MNSQGTIIKTFPYGYIKLPGAKTDAAMHKDPAAVAQKHRGSLRHVARRLRPPAHYYGATRGGLCVMLGCVLSSFKQI
jgi:hypothetical protein